MWSLNSQGAIPQCLWHLRDFLAEVGRENPSKPAREPWQAPPPSVLSFLSLVPLDFFWSSFTSFKVTESSVNAPICLVPKLVILQSDWFQLKVHLTPHCPMDHELGFSSNMNVPPEIGLYLLRGHVCGCYCCEWVCVCVGAGSCFYGVLPLLAAFLIRDKEREGEKTSLVLSPAPYT